MAITSVSAVADQVQKFWSALFMQELRESLLLGALVDKQYQGDLKQFGDTVRVSQINAPAGELKTVGVDADSFSSQALTTQFVDVKADKRAVAAFEFEDLVQLQSQIGQQDSEIRQALLFAVSKKVNDYLYSLVNPSAAAPDHLINGVTDFNASQVSAARMRAAQAKWMMQKGWWILADPSYYSDLLNATTLTSQDFVGGDLPVVGGQIANRRFGFNILEDNSAGLLTAGPASSGADVALIFHPDFMHLVMQTEPTFKVSDLHSNKQFGYLISVDLVFGAKLGIDGDKKHQLVYNT